MDMSIIVKGIMAAATLVYVANMHNKVSELKDRADSMQDDLNEIPMGFVEETTLKLANIEKHSKDPDVRKKDMDVHKKELKDHMDSELMKYWAGRNNMYDHDRAERERKLQEACDDFNSRIESIEKYLRDNKIKKS